jgi:hypothetical protein
MWRRTIHAHNKPADDNIRRERGSRRPTASAVCLGRFMERGGGTPLQRGQRIEWFDYAHHLRRM